MGIENSQSQMRKGILEYCILLLIQKRDAYASDIISLLKDSKIIVVEGTIYPLLTRLKNSEWLTYHWEESAQGPPRKYYSITEKGRDALKEMEQNWDELTDIVNKLKLLNNETNN